MKTNNFLFTVMLSALNMIFLCQANPEPTIFLENNYGASIYYKTSSNAQPKEVHNNIRIPLGHIESLEKTDTLIAGGSSLSVSYYSLKPTITKIGFSATQHPNSDVVIYINPSNFYQAWNIKIDWEKEGSIISPFKSKEILNQAAKDKLVKMLIFISKPVYKQGQGKNLQNVNLIDRTNDQTTKMALQMAINEPYGEQVLTELYDIINKQIPFQLNYQDEVNLKKDILTFIATEINRLK